MSKEKNIQQQLNRPNVPANLELKIKDNWQQQINQQGAKRKKLLPPLLATAASLVVVAIIFLSPASTPESVVAAVNDITDEIKHNNVGQSIALDDIRNIFNIEVTSDTTPVKMTKYCNLNGLQTLHLQIAGVRQGNVHYFIRRGEFSAAFWQPHQGEINHMPWKLIKPREGLSVLIFYSADMNPENAEEITRNMFYS